MVIKRILYVEDTISKAMDVLNQLKSMGYTEVEWVSNAKTAVEKVENADAPFDLFLFDMHFNFYGENDYSAGEHLMKLLREKGYDTPVVFCSSVNYIIPGAVGNIYYHPDRYWEDETKDVFERIKKM